VGTGPSDTRDMISRSEAVSIVREYQSKFRLNHWDIDVHFTGQQDADAIGECSAEPRYKSCSIFLNLDKAKSQDHLKRTVVHELFHLILSPYTSAATVFAGERYSPILEDLEDSIITDIERWPLWTTLISSE